MSSTDSVSYEGRTTSNNHNGHLLCSSINAVPDDFNENRISLKLIFLFIFDAIWSCFVVFPLIVMYWSGTWYLMDSFVFPNNLTLSIIICSITGFGTVIAMYFILPILHDRIEATWSIKHVLVSRTIIYVTALATLLIFKGIWDAVDFLVNKRLEYTVAILVFSQISLLVLKSSASAAGSPMVLMSDVTEDFYRTAPRCRTQLSTPLYYTLDVLLSVLLIFPLIILLWASLWQLFDALVLPNNPFLSMIISLAGGFGFTAILFGIQRPLERALIEMARPDRGWRDYCLAYTGDALYGCVCTVVVLMLWRGLWGLVRTYLLVHNGDGQIQWKLGLSFHVLVFMISWNDYTTGKTLGSVGCAVDGEYLITPYLSHQSEADYGIDLGAAGISRRTEYFTLYYNMRRLRGYQRVSTEASEPEDESENDENPSRENRPSHIST